MEKQKPVFDESRQAMYARLYPYHYEEMAARVKVGRTWGGKGVRQRVRALARQETRVHIRILREIKHGQSAPLPNV